MGQYRRLRPDVLKVEFPDAILLKVIQQGAEEVYLPARHDHEIGVVADVGIADKEGRAVRHPQRRDANDSIPLAHRPQEHLGTLTEDLPPDPKPGRQHEYRRPF